MPPTAAVGGASLTSDSNGNLTTEDIGHTLIYDAWNRLVQVKSGSTVLQTYGYDALGRRVSENNGTFNDVTKDSSWDELVEFVGEYTPAKVSEITGVGEGLFGLSEQAGRVN